jgi:hypothetical protein
MSTSNLINLQRDNVTNTLDAQTILTPLVALKVALSGSDE